MKAGDMAKIEKYIKNTGPIYRSEHYEVYGSELLAIAQTRDLIKALCLAFEYGRAKGYRAAKAEAKGMSKV